MKYRYENFGGIISSQNPPFLAYVDREFMRDLGAEASPLWQADESIGLLTAPTEVHFSVTNRCPVNCSHCYMGAGEPDPGEMDTETFKRGLDKMVAMNIFHIAMGGGEALARDDFFELATYAREIGLVPNLTMSGVMLTEDMLDKMSVLGQVNISLDGLGEHYAIYRKVNHFTDADRAIKLMRSAGIEVGINSVLGGENFDRLEELVAYASENGINEIEFLRFKPSGRAGEAARAQCMSYEQNVQLWPTLSQLSEKYDITLKIDCSFVPMLCYHNPDPELLSAMGTYGCEAGNILLGVRSNGLVSGCSFLETDQELHLFDLEDEWKDNSYLNKIRTFAERMEEPCRSCEYLTICKGGCHAVAKFVTGDIDQPDPDCPMVVEYRRKQS